MNSDQPIEKPENCEKCRKKSKNLTNVGSEDFPYWQCGTCIHREARLNNTREMWGRGRRGY